MESCKELLLLSYSDFLVRSCHAMRCHEMPWGESTPCPGRPLRLGQTSLAPTSLRVLRPSGLRLPQVLYPVNPSEFEGFPEAECNHRFSSLDPLIRLHTGAEEEPVTVTTAKRPDLAPRGVKNRLWPSAIARTEYLRYTRPPSSWACCSVPTGTGLLSPAGGS
jgi:hypothetical protein